MTKRKVGELCDDAKHYRRIAIDRLDLLEDAWRAVRQWSDHPLAAHLTLAQAIHHVMHDVRAQRPVGPGSQ